MGAHDCTQIPPHVGPVLVLFQGYHISDWFPCPQICENKRTVSLGSLQFWAQCMCTYLKIKPQLVDDCGVILPYYTILPVGTVRSHWYSLDMQLSRHIGSWFSPGVAHDHPAAPRWWMRRWASAVFATFWCSKVSVLCRPSETFAAFLTCFLIWNSWRLQLECGREGHPQAREGLLPSGSVGRLPGFAPKKPTNPMASHRLPHQTGLGEVPHLLRYPGEHFLGHGEPFGWSVWGIDFCCSTRWVCPEMGLEISIYGTSSGESRDKPLPFGVLDSRLFVQSQTEQLLGVSFQLQSCSPESISLILYVMRTHGYLSYLYLFDVISCYFVIYFLYLVFEMWCPPPTRSRPCLGGPPHRARIRRCDFQRQRTACVDSRMVWDTQNGSKSWGFHQQLEIAGIWIYKIYFFGGFIS